MIFNFIFLVMVYWMAGLPYQLFRFCLFALVGFIVSFVAEGMGLAIGATFSITVSINMIFNLNIFLMVFIQWNNNSADSPNYIKRVFKVFRATLIYCNSVFISSAQW